MNAWRIFFRSSFSQFDDDGNNYDKLSKVNLTKQCNYHYQLRKFHWNLILSRPASPQHLIQFDGQEDIDIKVVDSHYSF